MLAASKTSIREIQKLLFLLVEISVNVVRSCWQSEQASIKWFGDMQ
jgi:hypothetical protein